MSPQLVFNLNLFLSQSSGGRVLTGETVVPSVVEPPKFITGRHVAAIFEKLGFDPAAGQKAFNILCEALSRIKTENKDDPPQSFFDESDSSPEKRPNAALAVAFEEEEGDGTGAGMGAAKRSTTGTLTISDC